MFHSFHHEIVENCKITRVECSRRDAYLEEPNINTGKVVYTKLLIREFVYLLKRKAFENVTF